MSTTKGSMHAALWAAIDEVAQRCGRSPQALARAAGVSRTVFNPCRRHDCITGKPCWPTTNTIAKVLALAGMSFAEFGALVDQHANANVEETAR